MKLSCNLTVESATSNTSFRWHRWRSLYRQVIILFVVKQFRFFSLIGLFRSLYYPIHACIAKLVFFFKYFWYFFLMPIYKLKFFISVMPLSVLWFQNMPRTISYILRIYRKEPVLIIDYITKMVFYFKL